MADGRQVQERKVQNASSRRGEHPERYGGARWRHLMHHTSCIMVKGKEGIGVRHIQNASFGPAGWFLVLLAQI
jgi:hypothetical protein